MAGGTGGGWRRVCARNAGRFWTCKNLLVPFWVHSFTHITQLSYPVAVRDPTHPAMRKAQGLARGRSRRKQQGGDGPAQQQAAQGPGGGGGGGGPAQHHLQNQNGGGGPEGGGPPQPAPQRRKPTPEEQALTAKNYRLAKELVS